MKANIKTSLYRKTAAAILLLLQNVIAKLTGNLFFPNPPHLPAALQLKADKLIEAIGEATNGSKASKIHRNTVAKEAADMLRAVADYERMVANGDADMLATGGFELSRRPEPIDHLGIPGRVKAVATDKKGEIEFRFGKVRGAYYYNVYVAHTDPAEPGVTWKLHATTTRARNTYDGFESFKAVWFCASAVGVNGEGLQSDPAMGRAA